MEQMLLFVSLLFLVVFIFSLISAIFLFTLIFGRCLVLKKLGEKPWKGMIPFYGTYTLFKSNNINVSYYVFYICSLVILSIAKFIYSPVASILFIFLGLSLYVYSLWDMYSVMVKKLNLTQEYVIGLLLFDEIFFLLIGLNKNAKLTQESITTDTAEAYTNKICPKCGKEIDKEDVFCKYCGQDQSKKVRKKKSNTAD